MVGWRCGSGKVVVSKGQEKFMEDEHRSGQEFNLRSRKVMERD